MSLVGKTQIFSPSPYGQITGLAWQEYLYNLEFQGFVNS